MSASEQEATTGDQEARAGPVPRQHRLLLATPEVSTRVTSTTVATMSTRVQE